MSLEGEKNVPFSREAAVPALGIKKTRLTLATNGASANGHGETATGEPLPKGEDIVEQLNREYAVVMVGNGVSILREGADAEGRFEYRLLSVDAFREKLRPYKDFRDGERPVPYATIWLGDKRRREFDGIAFSPGLETPGYYNLWRESEVVPDARGAAGCPRFLEHVASNVCKGDAELFAWVMGWFAAIIQKPREKTGNSIVLKGPQGAGKTIVGQIIGSLLGRHYFLAGDSRFVTGRFNAHLANCLLLQLDEATWGGDHAATGKLKDLITGDTQIIEFKGKEPIVVKNYVRLLISSNNDWVIPAGLEERRFCTIEIGEDQLQNAAYFQAILREQRTGGQGSLLHYLQTYDLRDIALAQIPTTAALFEQKNASLSPEMSWWLDVLRAGSLPGDRHGAGQTPCAALYDHYLEHARKRGIRHGHNETGLGMFLDRYAPGRVRRKITLEPGSGKRPYCYVFPTLAVCRGAFDRAARTSSSWDALEDWAADPGGGSP